MSQDTRFFKFGHALKTPAIGPADAVSTRVAKLAELADRVQPASLRCRGGASRHTREVRALAPQAAKQEPP